MDMSLSGARFQTSTGVDRMVQDGAERLRALPGVEFASATCCVPLEGGYGLPFQIVGRPLEQGPFHGGGAWLTVSPGYFDVFKIPVKRGRAFTDRDTSAGPPVVIINEAMARQFWKDGDPLSERLIIGRGVMREFASEPERQVIGVVGDVRGGGLNNEPGPTMYIPQGQVPDAVNALNMRISTMKWVVRTRTEPYALSSAIQEQLRQATGPAGLGDPDDGGRGRAVDVAPALQHAADDRVRCGGGAAGGDRHLRADGVLGRAAHAGNRHPPRAWRRSRAACAG